MKWIGNRISIVENKDATTLVIYPEQSTWKSTLLYSWFSMWTAIGVLVTLQFFENYSREEKLILVVFMVFWTYFFVRIGRSVLWQAKGKELIKLNDQAFILKKSIFGYGKAHEYFYENIKKIRVYEPKPNSFEDYFQNAYFFVGGERLIFDYAGKEIRFARKLDEKETKLFFQYLTKQIETKLRRK
jgi:mRNA-degrading endonuclease HigB of HigAB toxin-antitoxin module